MNTRTKEMISNSNNKLPMVLVDYLKKLIWSNQSITFIILNSRQLSMGDIQEIICETTDEPIYLQVCGFDPVDTCLEVQRSDKQIELVPA